MEACEFLDVEVMQFHIFEKILKTTKKPKITLDVVVNGEEVPNLLMERSSGLLVLSYHIYVRQLF